MTTKLENYAEGMVKFIKKYAPKEDVKYTNLHDLAHHHTLDHVYPDMEWHYIIDYAWKLAYRQALLDNTLSLEERYELNQINRMFMSYKNDGYNRVALNHTILMSFKNLIEIDLKADSYERKYENKYEQKVERSWLPTPKPSPWDRNS